MNKCFKFIIILVVLAFMFAIEALAYDDHRNRKVDSVEHVLKTSKLEGKELFKAYDDLMHGYLQTDGKKAAHYARLGIVVAEKENFLIGLNESWRILGLVAYGGAQYDSALCCFNRSLEVIGRMKGDKRYTDKDIDSQYSTMYGTIGNLYNIQGKLHLALDYYQKALPLFEKHGWKESEALLYSNVGELYLELGNYKAAEQNYRNGIRVARTTGDSLILSMPSSGLAMVLLNERKYEEALEYAGISMEYNKAHVADEPVGLMDGYVLYSRIYQHGFKNLDKAQKYVGEAMELSRKVDAPVNVSAVYAQQASIYLDSKEWRKASVWAQKSLDMNSKDPQHNIEVYKILAEAYSGMGDAAMSQKYITLLYEEMTKTANGRYQSALSEMEVRYQTGRKEMQIIQLGQEKKMMRLQNVVLFGFLFVLVAVGIIMWRWSVQKKRIATMQAKIDGEANERIRIGRDLHDRMGAKLTLLKMKMKENVYDDVESLELCDEAIAEMRRIAHHLMPQSLYKDGLPVAIEDFCHAMPGVEYHFAGEERRLSVYKETIIYCAIHELVNNAIKHGKATHIEVHLMMTDEYTAAIISDNGKGFGNAVQEGFGLGNIRQRVEALGGRFSISTSGQGTEAILEL